MKLDIGGGVGKSRRSHTRAGVKGSWSCMLSRCGASGTERRLGIVDAPTRGGGGQSEVHRRRRGRRCLGSDGIPVRASRSLGRS